MNTTRKIFSHFSMLLGLIGFGLIVSAAVPPTVPPLREHFDEEWLDCIHQNREGDRLRGYPGPMFDEYFAEHGKPVPYLEYNG